MANPNYCTIYLVRHGESEGNLTQITQGQLDTALTQTGVIQARQLAQALKPIKFTAAYSSDLLRAYKTAEIIATERQLSVVTSKLIRERYFGRFQGRPWQYFQKQLDKLIQNKQELQCSWGNLLSQIDHTVETDDQIAARSLLFLRQIALAHLGQNILVVSHGGSIRAVLTHLGIFNEADFRLIRIENTAYIKLRSDGTDFFIDAIVGITKSS